MAQQVRKLVENLLLLDRLVAEIGANAGDQSVVQLDRYPTLRQALTELEDSERASSTVFGAV